MTMMEKSTVAVKDFCLSMFCACAVWHLAFPADMNIEVQPQTQGGCRPLLTECGRCLVDTVHVVGSVPCVVSSVLRVVVVSRVWW